MTRTGAHGTPSQGTSARTRAQAKVNLFLRVLAREAGGYHQLETLFCRLELGDEVVVRTNVRGRSLDCVGDAVREASLGPVERNLAWRAAVAYVDAAGWPNDWSIEIVKHVPIGGGLGGGSADAGAVLRCLNALAPSPLSTADLLALATPLGADVPFLTLDTPLALAWGRGERMLALPCLPSRNVTLACFPFGVSTPAAYGWLDEEPTPQLHTARVVAVADLTSWAGAAARAHNDFERVVVPRFARIAETLATWRASLHDERDESAFAMLAGSGSTVFAVADRDMPPPDAGGGGEVRVVATRTATRVVGVEASD
jgi:4-diphosphocytidyl-2-C-methyl-D-erythritol kinase